MRQQSTWQQSPSIDPRDIRILIDIPKFSDSIFGAPSQTPRNLTEKSKSQIREWLVDVYQKVVSDSFHRYYIHQLLQNQVKAFTGKNILINIQKFMNQTKVGYKYSEEEQRRLYGFIERQSTLILNKIILKYPQESATEGARKLNKEISETNIRQSDEFDLLRSKSATIVFQSKNNFYSQILQTLNYVIQLPTQSFRDNKTLFEGFQSLISNLFNYAGYENFYKTLEQLAISYNSETNKQLKQNKFKALCQINRNNYNLSELEAYQKDSPSQFSINQKIPSSIRHYTSQEIKEGTFSTTDVSILRVLTKWAEELQEKILQSQANINKKTQVFKDNLGNLIELSTLQKSLLHNMAQNNMKQNTVKISKELKSHCVQMCSRLAGLKEKCLYMNEVDGNLALLADRIQGSVSNYMFVYINQLLKSLTRLPTLVYGNISKNSSRQKFMADQIQSLNLITFKIGDLMRGKCKSNQNHIIKVYSILKLLTEKCPQILKIIRVKNRLDKKDNDVLINLFFMNKVICQIQLSVSSSRSPQEKEKKQKMFNQFNHLIYELNRSKFGPIVESACLLAQYNPLIKHQVRNRTKKTEESPSQYNKIQFTTNKVKYASYLPMFCKKCQKYTKLTNSAFYQGSRNLGLCNECYENDILKGDSNKYIQQIFRQDQNRKQKILKHFTLIDFKQIRQIRDFLGLKQGYIVFKNKAQPYPQYCKFETCRFDNQNQILYALASKDHSNIDINSTPKEKNAAKIAKIVFQSEQSKLKANTKQILLFVLKSQKGVEKITNSKGMQEYIHRCICCPEKTLKLRNQFTVPFSQLNYDNNMKIIQKTYKENKTGLLLAEKEITDQLMSIKQDNIISTLYLNGNSKIGDKTCLSKFKHLQILNLNQCRIEDLDSWKISSQLKNLKQLKLSYNFIEKIAGLENMTSLKHLYLDNNAITEINGLKSLINVTDLHLEGNRIQVIQNLQNLTSIEKLHLQFNQIKKIQGLSHLKKLNQLYLIKNMIDVSNFHDIQNASSAKIINLRGNIIPKDEALVQKQLKRLREKFPEMRIIL